MRPTQTPIKTKKSEIKDLSSAASIGTFVPIDATMIETTTATANEIKLVFLVNAFS